MRVLLGKEDIGIHFAHLDKPASETLGAIPIGLIFGWVALTSGAIWGPVIAHCVIAISNDFFCHRKRSP